MTVEFIEIELTIKKKKIYARVNQLCKLWNIKEKWDVINFVFVCPPVLSNIRNLRKTSWRKLSSGRT